MLVRPPHSGYIAEVAWGTLSSGVWRELAAEYVAHIVCTGHRDSHMSLHDPGGFGNKTATPLNVEGLPGNSHPGSSCRYPLCQDSVCSTSHNIMCIMNQHSNALATQSMAGNCSTITYVHVHVHTYDTGTPEHNYQGANVQCAVVAI